LWKWKTWFVGIIFTWFHRKNKFLNNIEYEDNVFKIKIRPFICDAYARAMLKMIMGHTSKHDCEKCYIVAKTKELNKFSKSHFKKNYTIR